ncbi:MAG: hypothetical protein AB8D78_15675 [Akkermansiaceae bacterium]
MKSSFLVILLLGLGVSLLSADAEQRTCRIIFPDRPKDAPDSAFLFDGKLSKEIRLPSRNFSRIVSLPEGELKMFLTLERASGLGAIPEGSPSVVIPASVTDFHLIVLSDPENDVLPVRILPVEADGFHLKPGSTLWINLSKTAIKATLGESSLLLLADSSVMTDAPLAANGYYEASFFYKQDAEDEFVPMTKKSWWHDSTSSGLGVVVDSGGRLPRIHLFRDYRAPNTEK